MKFSYKFSNLLGCVYRKGNVQFAPDGNRLVSPVGNRLTIFDLKNNKSETLPIQSRMNITAVTLSPDGMLMIVVNEEGEALLCSLVSKTLLHVYHFHRPVHAISFSPDGKKFAATKENMVIVFHTPGHNLQFNPFVMYRTFYGAYDETVSIDWTTDSAAFCVGSKDMNTRVYGAQKFQNLIIYSLGGHTHPISNAFFEQDSLDLYTVSVNGQLCVWECDTGLADLKPDEAQSPTTDDETEEREEDESSTEKGANQTQDKILYKRLAKHNFKEARGEKVPYAKLSSAAFHKLTHILVTGFEDGSFFIHEMPDFNLIHSLSISDQTIASIAFNKPGDWIALACGGLGQLLVWEWQSESYVLKQQGHFNNMNCLAYSPTGQHIVTGGTDGKVKVWNTTSGFCFVTFSEHTGGITGSCFNQTGQVVVSSSLDGTVRAFDLNRYRNFRTFTSPRPVQFSCLAVDHSGEIVSAGGLDCFDVFVWSLQTGRLLEVLSGHEGPISSLAFASTHSILASGSWDKTVKLWDVFESKGARETLQVMADVLALAYRPDGKELAVACLNCHITFWDVHTATQTGSIEGRADMGYSRRETDKITAKTSAAGKAFSTLSYTADGACVLAGGKSKNICIYSVAEKMLIKKFEITHNLSFDGTEEFLDRRKMTAWGSLALVDEGQGDGKSISLPGVRKGDMSSRHWKPEVCVGCVQFSPTGRAWAATTTEGLMIYSLDHNLVFDPFELAVDITPASVRRSVTEHDWLSALMLSLRLNEQLLIQEVLEKTPVTSVEFIVQSLPDTYVDRVLLFIGSMLENTHHLEFYLLWCEKILLLHGPKLKQRSHSVMATLTTLQKNLTRHQQDIGKICDFNQYMLQYIKCLGKATQKRTSEQLDDGDSDSSDGRLGDSDLHVDVVKVEIDSDAESTASSNTESSIDSSSHSKSS